MVHIDLHPDQTKTNGIHLQMRVRLTLVTCLSYTRRATSPEKYIFEPNIVGCNFPQMRATLGIRWRYPEIR